MGLPWCPAVKNPPCKGKDPWVQSLVQELKIPCAAGQLSLSTTTSDPGTTTTLSTDDTTTEPEQHSQDPTPKRKSRMLELRPGKANK